MLYILGVNLSDEKCLIFALKKFSGIGYDTSKKICDKLHIHAQLRVRDMTESQMVDLIKEVKDYTTGVELEKFIKSNIETLINIKSYRGLRHSQGLPVRGQRTRSNSKTQKKKSKPKTTAKKKIFRISKKTHVVKKKNQNKGKKKK